MRSCENTSLWSLCIVVLVCLLVSFDSKATQCSAIFNDAVGSWSSSGKIEFKKNSRLINSDGTIDFKEIDYSNSGGKSCGNAHCQITGNATEKLDLTAFKTSNSGAKKEAKKNKTLNVNQGEYEEVKGEQNARITFVENGAVTVVKDAQFAKNNRVTLQNGIYWFEKLELGENTTLSVEPGHSVTVYVKDFQAKKNAKLNQNGTLDQLLFIMYEDAVFEENTQTNAYVYGKKKVELKKNAILVGAINAKEVILGENVRVTYDETGLSNLGFGDLCEDEEDKLLAHYSFINTDDTSTAVDDDSGNGNLANFLGTTQSTLPAPNVSCRALFIPDVDLNESNGMRTPLNVTDDIGDEGTISLWFRSETNWTQNTGTRLIFDASLDLSGRGGASGRYFTLRKQGDGRLWAGFEDTDDRDLQIRTKKLQFQAGEWVHIAMTWDTTNKSASLYVNGQDETNIVQNTFQNKPIAKLGMLTFGDNSTDYRSNKSANGIMDEIRVYNYVQTLQQIQTDMNNVAPCSNVHHYLITHPETALTCTNPDITITACADEDCSLTYTGESTVNILPNSVEGGNVVTFTGSSTVQLNNRTAGELTLSLSSASPSAAFQCEPDCTIDYSDAGFEFFNTTTGGTSFDDQKLVAENSLVEVGIRTGGGNCGSLVNATKTVSLTYECISSPDASYSSSACQVDFAGITRSLGSTHAGTIQLAFNEDGEADFSNFNFPDSGLVKLSVAGISNGANISTAQTTLKIVPDRLEISTDATDPQIAGVPFSLSIRALGAAGGELKNFQVNSFEARFNQLSPLDINSNNADLVFDNISVASTFDQTFTGLNSVSFAAGVFTSATTWISDLGQYTLQVRDLDYLGQQINSNTLTFGRLIPAYFDVEVENTPSFADSCSGSFTYVGQEFVYNQNPRLRVTAYNGQGGVTRNYADTLWTLNPSESDVDDYLDFTDGTSYSGELEVLDKGSAPLITNQSVFDGVATIALTNAQMQYEKITAPVNADASPFDTNVTLSIGSEFFLDSDLICFQSNYPDGCVGLTIEDIQGTEQRYGRLALDNTFGPETHSLTVPIRTEYLIDGIWKVNEQDSCTALNLSQSGGDIEIIHHSESQNDLSAAISDLSATGTLSYGLSSGSMLNVDPIIQGGRGVPGSFWLRFDPDGADDQWNEFLNIDWNMDNVIDSDDKPEALVTFGLFRGNDRMIHWREVFNE